MMPVIRVSDTTYRLLQKHAIPLEDNNDSMVYKAIKFFDQHHTPVSNQPIANEHKIDANSQPDLRHTKILDAHFNNVKIKNWNGLLKEALIQAWQKAEDFNALRRMTTANIVQGKRSDSGYAYIPEIDISVQGIDSTSAWRLSKEIAQKLNVSLSVDFIWRDKKGAAHPGKNGQLNWLSKITL